MCSEANIIFPGPTMRTCSMSCLAPQKILRSCLAHGFLWLFVYLVQGSEKPLALPTALRVQERVAVAQHGLHPVANGRHRDG